MNIVFFVMGLVCFAPAAVGVADMIVWFWTDHQLSFITWEPARGAFVWFSSMFGAGSVAIACKLTD